MDAGTVKWLMICVAGSNLAAFLAFALDKRRAENGAWRIPERTLLTFAFYGGSLGALLGQQVLRHKTRKEPFRTYLLVIASCHIALAALVFIFLQAPEQARVWFSAVASLDQYPDPASLLDFSAL
jgi:uncharacterized membrane protein YsdA (DUF1294 family)